MIDTWVGVTFFVVVLGLVLFASRHYLKNLILGDVPEGGDT